MLTVNIAAFFVAFENMAPTSPKIAHFFRPSSKVLAYQHFGSTFSTSPAPYYCYLLSTGDSQQVLKRCQKQSASWDRMDAPIWLLQACYMVISVSHNSGEVLFER